MGIYFAIDEALERYEEKNRLAKQVIDKVSYVRIGAEAEIKVDFL